MPCLDFDTKGKTSHFSNKKVSWTLTLKKYVGLTLKEYERVSLNRKHHCPTWAQDVTLMSHFVQTKREWFFLTILINMIPSENLHLHCLWKGITTVTDHFITHLSDHFITQLSDHLIRSLIRSFKTKMSENPPLHFLRRGSSWYMDLSIYYSHWSLYPID